MGLSCRGRVAWLSTRLGPQEALREEEVQAHGPARFVLKTSVLW